MPRSRKKGPFVPEHLAKKVVAMKAAKIKSPIETYARNSDIVPQMENLTFKVHNGRGFTQVYINSEKIGKKLGAFAPTRTYSGHRQTDKKTKTKGR